MAAATWRHISGDQQLHSRHCSMMLLQLARQQSRHHEGAARRAGRRAPAPLLQQHNTDPADADRDAHRTSFPQNCGAERPHAVGRARSLSRQCQKPLPRRPELRWPSTLMLNGSIKLTSPLWQVEAGPAHR